MRLPQGLRVWDARGFASLPPALRELCSSHQPVWPDYAARVAFDECERCGREADLVTVRHRGGMSRELCPACAEGVDGWGRDDWRWFHYGRGPAPNVVADDEEEDEDFTPDLGEEAYADEDEDDEWS